MCPVFVWTTDGGSLSADRFPEVFNRFEISSVDRSGPLPSEPGVLLVDAELLRAERRAVKAFVNNGGTVVATTAELETDDDLPFDVVSARPTEAELLRTLRNATRYVDSQLRLEELNAIGIALSAERNHDRLLELILTKAREITNADAGSLFLVADIDERIVHPDGTEARAAAQWLKFRLAQNDSRELRFEEDVLPISPESIAGYVAQTGKTLNLADAYDLPKDKPFVINRSFDEATGYRAHSMLVVPMENAEGETIGVLQLINKKNNRESVLDTTESFERGVLPFDQDDERLVRSLASQAAVCVDNNSLYVERENLFRQFVNAAVQAIESRDPTTQGHSKRVALMTIALAEVTNHVERGTYGSFRLTDDEIRELNYAALLHDFGKVGVTEKVLIKATKLYHGELSTVRQRFKTIRRTLEAQYVRRMLDRLMQNEASPEEIEQMKRELAGRLDSIDEARAAVEAANIPTVTHSAEFDKLMELSQLTYEDIDGSELPYLNDDELTALTVARGTLTGPEREQIESHVVHTFDFLSTIPWTRDLQSIPDLARSHHEKLDGSGYPKGRGAADISPQTRMMTISDIYDALTASDRPYKPAVSTVGALDILNAEFAGKVDQELLDLFIEAKVYEHGAGTD
ncbi:MAG: HD family phosphohydrolase [Acidobacteriota bacterium]|nr:MAG: HD family phosphohydrolase [Acidobacteriota bacterium]